MYRWGLAVVVPAVLAAACGLEAVGELRAGAVAEVGPDGAAAPPGPGGTLSETDAGSTVASIDSPPAPVPEGCNPDKCAFPIAPPGFSHVLFGNGASPCPAGFDTQELVANPLAKPGSCACGACTMQGTTCSTGNAGSKYSTNDECGNTGDGVNVNNGNCVEYDGQFISNYAATVPPAAVVGSCKAAATTVAANIQSDTRRACIRRAETCPEVACTPGGDLEVCLVSNGDVECPPVAPQRQLIGTEVLSGCADCTCTTQATCGGTMTFYPQAGCVGTPRVLQANVCTRVDEAQIGSLKWTGAVATQECTGVTPPQRAIVGLTSPHTICCP